MAPIAFRPTRIFRGKSWMDWVRFALCGLVGLALVGVGIAEIGGITDAMGVVRHDAVIPCLVTAPIVLALSAMFLINAIGRSLPVIELYREGIVCRLVGRSHEFTPTGRIGLMIQVLSGAGFASSSIGSNGRPSAGRGSRGWQ